MKFSIRINIGECESIPPFYGVAYRRLGKRWQQGIPDETRQYLRKVQNKYYGRL